MPLLQFSRSSCNRDWLFANASACISCGFRLHNACNARNASDCVWMETGLYTCIASMWLISNRLRLLREIFTQQTQEPANRNALSKQWQPWLAACQRKRLRFLRFSFTQASPNLCPSQAIAFKWKPGFSQYIPFLVYTEPALTYVHTAYRFIR